jgi:hypothetical protein
VRTKEFSDETAEDGYEKASEGIKHPVPSYGGSVAYKRRKKYPLNEPEYSIGHIPVTVEFCIRLGSDLDKGSLQVVALVNEHKAIHGRKGHSRSKEFLMNHSPYTSLSVQIRFEPDFRGLPFCDNLGDHGGSWHVRRSRINGR